MGIEYFLSGELGRGGLACGTGARPSALNGLQARVEVGAEAIDLAAVAAGLLADAGVFEVELIGW
jgi:hypothetical protein